jgi:hypothetical protein
MTHVLVNVLTFFEVWGCIVLSLAILAFLIEMFVVFWEKGGFLNLFCGLLTRHRMFLPYCFTCGERIDECSCDPKSYSPWYWCRCGKHASPHYNQLSLSDEEYKKRERKKRAKKEKK